MRNALVFSMNLDFDAFTYITGIAGLLGLMLQLKDSFPEYREVRKTIVLLVIGVFVGSIISSLKGVKVDFATSIGSFEILVAVFVAVLAVVAIAGAFTRKALADLNSLASPASARLPFSSY